MAWRNLTPGPADPWPGSLYHKRLADSLPAILGGQTLDQLIDEQQPSQTYAPFPTAGK